MQVIEILNTRVAELNVRKKSVENKNYAALVAEEVAKYEAERIEHYQAEKNAKIESIDNDIATLERWLSEESKKIDSSVATEAKVEFKSTFISPFQKPKTN